MDEKENILIAGPIDPGITTHLISVTTEEHDIGAYSLFMGQVRADEISGKRVKKIIYSAYEEMVIDEALKIRKEILNAYNDLRQLKIMHSIGEVKKGEISMLVFVASGHRDHAFKACREIVEKIKKRLPIWKQEIFDDNTHHWKGSIDSEDAGSFRKPTDEKS